MKKKDLNKTQIKEMMITNFVFFIKLPLWPLVILYLLIIKSKNFLYDKKIVKTKKLSKPVVSIGNISVGGSGKTALVLSLIQKLNDVCVLTRGYKSEVTKKKIYPKLVQKNSTNMYGDEPSMIESQMQSGVVVIDPDRYRGGQFALNTKKEIKVFILDDGFQHRKLHRDLDLLVFDMDTFVKSMVFGLPLTSLMLIPFGKYREPLSSLRRADWILISKWKHLNPRIVDDSLKIIKKFNPNIMFLESEIKSLINAQGDKLDRGKIILFSGLGNPFVFEQDISNTFPNLIIIEHKKFKDHYQYSLKDIQDLVKMAKTNNANLVCSEKDYIKIKEYDLSESQKMLYFSQQSLRIDSRLSGLVNSIYNNLDSVR